MTADRLSVLDGSYKWTAYCQETKENHTHKQQPSAVVISDSGWHRNVISRHLNDLSSVSHTLPSYHTTTTTLAPTQPTHHTSSRFTIVEFRLFRRGAQQIETHHHFANARISIKRSETPFYHSAPRLLRSFLLRVQSTAPYGAVS